MDAELISKKDLLTLTDISYGQLYRWKRKNLIPEDWFIRKSTFTGQETFFPKEKILLRIQQIKNMKDGLSLDELADMFSPNPSEISLTYDECISRNIVTKAALDLFVAVHPNMQVFPFEELLCVYVLGFALETGDISLEEGKTLVQTMLRYYSQFPERNCEMILFRKLGVATCVLVSSPTDLYTDDTARKVIQLHLPTCVEHLKLKLS